MNWLNFFRNLIYLSEEEAAETIAELQSKLAVKMDRGSFVKEKNSCFLVLCCKR